MFKVYIYILLLYVTAYLGSAVAALSIFFCRAETQRNRKSAPYQYFFLFWNIVVFFVLLWSNNSNFIIIKDRFYPIYTIWNIN